MTRQDIRTLDISGEVKSTDGVGGEKFKIKFKSIVSESELTACQIHNGDGTGLLQRSLSNSTITGGDWTNVKNYKKNKDWLIVLLWFNLPGDHKIKPFAIIKSKDPRALKCVKKNNEIINDEISNDEIINNEINSLWSIIKCMNDARVV